MFHMNIFKVVLILGWKSELVLYDLCVAESLLILLEYDFFLLMGFLF